MYRLNSSNQKNFIMKPKTFEMMVMDFDKLTYCILMRFSPGTSRLKTYALNYNRAIEHIEQMYN